MNLMELKNVRLRARESDEAKAIEAQVLRISAGRQTEPAGPRIGLVFSGEQASASLLMDCDDALALASIILEAVRISQAHWGNSIHGMNATLERAAEIRAGIVGR